jgi:hypothetical protein
MRRTLKACGLALVALAALSNFIATALRYLGHQHPAQAFEPHHEALLVEAPVGSNLRGWLAISSTSGIPGLPRKITREVAAQLRSTGPGITI